MNIKEKMINYWSIRMPSFSVLRAHELELEKSVIWLEEINKYIDKSSNLKVLDIGTGTGFFCFLLAREGHSTVGIDITPQMIEEAKRLSKEYNIPSEFYVMDAEKPEFEEQSFDVIVSRNLTWQLPHLGDAYKKWYKLLKPNGILINFDGDYCHEDNTNVVLPENHAHKAVSKAMKDDYENMKADLRNYQKLRPEWDIELLKEAGFKNIEVDTGIWDRAYAKRDEFFNPTHTFAITARA